MNKKINWQTIKLLILDIDGVLTDGRLYYGDNGEIFKVFYVRDGVGIKNLLAHGIQVAAISGRSGPFTKARLKDLGIELSYLGIKDKVAAYHQLKEQLNFSKEEIAYVGDDIIDLPVMKEVGVKIAVQDAEPEVLEIADYVTRLSGGKGAVREVANLILGNG